MSNELKKIVKDIQFRTDKTIEEIARDIGYARAYFTNQVNIGTNKNLRKLLLDKYKLDTEHNVRNETKSDIIITEKNGEVGVIEIKTASGKTIQVKPEGQSEITLLNAFLEERDRVIETLKEEKQARIDELSKDKEDLMGMLNSALGKIYASQQIALAYQKAWVDYEAEKVAKGDHNKKKELMYKMGKLVDGMIQNDSAMSSLAETDKLRKEGQ